mmetsp:Transcript_7301/g.13160  ORF Transcript_7301/g.13160 Transcript_7301/m.13160 type:complete len:567 (+) Transcript_7301:894-2594(+)
MVHSSFRTLCFVTAMNNAMGVFLSPKFPEAMQMYGVTPSRVDTGSFVPSLPSSYKYQPGEFCHFRHNTKVPFAEVFGCFLIQDYLIQLGGYPSDVPLSREPSESGYLLTQLFNTSSIARMVRDKCFRVRVNFSPQVDQSSYSYSSYESYVSVMKNTFNIAVSASGSYKSFVSVSAKASYQQETSSTVQSSGVQQASGGSKRDLNAVAVLTNECLWKRNAECNPKSGKGCMKDYLSPAFMAAWEPLKDAPYDVNLMRDFAKTFGTTLPAQWVFGASEQLDMSVKYDATSTAKSSDVSKALSAAITASGANFGASAATNMESAFSQSIGTASSNTRLQTRYTTSGQCDGTIDQASCTNLLLGDIRKWGQPFKVTNFVGIDSMMLADAQKQETLARTLFYASSPCLSLSTATNKTVPATQDYVAVSMVDTDVAVDTQRYLECRDGQGCSFVETLLNVWKVDADPDGYITLQGVNPLTLATADNMYLGYTDGQTPTLQVGYQASPWRIGADGSLCTLVFGKGMYCLDDAANLVPQQSLKPTTTLNAFKVGGYVFKPMDPNVVVHACALPK